MAEATEQAAALVAKAERCSGALRFGTLEHARREADLVIDEAGRQADGYATRPVGRAR